MITPPRLIDIKHPCSCTLESTIGIILYTQKASILNYFCTSRSSVIIIPPSPDVIFLIPSILIHTTSPKILLTDLYNKCQMHVMHLLLLVDYAFCKFIYSIKITTLSSIMYRHYSLRFWSQFTFGIIQIDSKRIIIHMARHYELSLSLNLNSLQRFVS